MNPATSLWPERTSTPILRRTSNAHATAAAGINTTKSSVQKTASRENMRATSLPDWREQYRALKRTLHDGCMIGPRARTTRPSIARRPYSKGRTGLFKRNADRKVWLLAWGLTLAFHVLLVLFFQSLPPLMASAVTIKKPEPIRLNFVQPSKP